jgi:tocopherol O-methyltransferase
MTRTNDKARVVDHYNRVTPYYRALWGEHIHHGYWIRGDESKDTAQLQLIDYLVETARIEPHSRVLDIGCGFGGSSIYLARKYGVRATGITISPLQVEMANRDAAEAGVSASFLCMDAESMHFAEPFDALWSVESISHYQDIPRFFAHAASFLKSGGTFAITDWFKQKSLEPREHQKLLYPIEDGMMIELHTMRDYENYLAEAGFEVSRSEVLNKQTAKTWDLSLDIIKDKALWELAASFGPEFVRFLRAFKAIRSGFSSGNFVYGLIVAKKPL